MRVYWVVVWATLALPVSAYAEEEDAARVEQVAQEVFIGAMPFAQEQFELQLSTSARFTRGEEQQQLEIPLVVELGLTDRLQVEVELPLAVLSPSGDFMRDGSTGLGNMEVGALYNLFNDGRSGVVASVGLSFVLPTSTMDGIERVVGILPSVAAYKTFGPVHVNASLNGGVEFPVDSEEGANPVVEGGLALLFPVGPLVPMVEGTLEYDGETVFRSAAGLIWVIDDFEIGAAALMNVSGGETEWGAVVSATIEFSFGKE
jgi:hypothetical protein